MSDDLVREFLVESTENLDTLDRELVLLEKDARDSKILASVFRTIHTIKGTCGFLGFTKLEKVAHAGENLLASLRDGKLELRTEIASGLMSMVDAVRHMLEEIATTGQDGHEDYRRLIETLTNLQQPVTNHAQLPPSSRPSSGGQTPLCSTGRKEPPEVPAGAATKTSTLHTANSSSAETPHTTQPKSRSNEAIPPTQPSPENQGARDAASSTIRVDVSLLDKLMNLVGELVLARNQVLRFTSSVENNNLTTTGQHLNQVTTELQEGVMKTRMQPIGNIWGKFPRIVRDVAIGCGKQARIEMFGTDTELDKTIIEAIKDPLTHLVRNAVDHGIERPEARVAAGKSAEGCLTLRAYHQSGQVNIEIIDDGAGLDHDKIRNKAIERGLLSADKAAQLSEREAIHLIFAPGFSTAEKVTNVSGRGVGMDVVKTNIEKIGGTVEVQSISASGTVVKMKIPLTLAILPGLVIACAGRRFVVPQVSLMELVRIDTASGHGGIEMVHGVPVYRLRGRLLPLVYLDRELQLQRKSAPAENEDLALNMVVLQADGRQFGLIVDEIRDCEEIVVKPLSRRLKDLKIFAGATIMGDGTVALILDILGLAQRAGVISEQRDSALAASESASDLNVAVKQTFLLFSGPDSARMALPLDRLARLEELPGSQIEKSGAQWVIQYRGEILPLIWLCDVVEERRRQKRHSESLASNTGTLQVLVCNYQGRSVGIVVEKILDIVEDHPAVTSPATRGGVLCAAVLDGRVTELLDFAAILRAAEGSREPEEEHVKVGD